MRVLIADDEKDLCLALSAILEHAHYLTDIAEDGEEALYLALNRDYDALILDVMMPKMDGFAVLRELRRRGSDLPVLMLTAKGELEDRVAGLRSGADDYLSKPFAMPELLARLEALLRRPRAYRESGAQFGGLRLEKDRAVMTFAGREAELTNKELQLMELFLRRPGQIFSKEQLMNKVWGEESESDTGVVWTNISSLRRKLEGLGAPLKIRNQRGLGYSLTEG